MTTADGKRITVRPGKYHGREGFHVTASNGPSAWPQKVFCRTERGAREVEAAIADQSRLQRDDPDYAAFDRLIDDVLAAGL